jgi:hypothetical protein
MLKPEHRAMGAARGGSLPVGGAATWFPPARSQANDMCSSVPVLGSSGYRLGVGSKR